MTEPDTLVTGMSAFVDAVASAMSIHTTDDPAHVTPPCVFIGAPAIVNRTLGAYVLEVPVSLIAPSLGDIAGRNYLLIHTPDLLDAVGARTADPRPYELGDLSYPSMKTTATLTIRSTT